MSFHQKKSIISLGLSEEDSSKLLVTLETRMEADRIQENRGQPDKPSRDRMPYKVKGVQLGHG
jgi:hypothetical protein